MKTKLLNLFLYDREQGVLIWKNPPQPNTKRLTGKLAGTTDKEGYLVTMIDKKCYKVHRLIYFLETGKWVEKIDHISGDKQDNRIINLRNVNHRQNMSNTYRHRKGKLIGASFHRGSWRSVIIRNKKQIHLGYFTTEIEAHKRYLQELRSLNE